MKLLPFNRHPAESFLRRTRIERAEQIKNMPLMVSITKEAGLVKAK